MAVDRRIPDVGGQDPERRNSPVVAEVDEDQSALREAEMGAECFFNDEAFRSGAYVRSGAGFLRCSHGVWVEAGPSDPDNP